MIPKLFWETDVLSPDGKVRLRTNDHTYWLDKKELIAVSKVIDTIYAVKSWKGVDPMIIENAAKRGLTVDHYMSEFLRHGSITVDDSEEVQTYVRIAVALWEAHFARIPAIPQQIVYSVEDGIAGMMDFWIGDDTLIDLKCTRQVETSWILQLGAYAHMSPTFPKKLGVLHVSPKLYVEGGRLLWYDVATCIRYWGKAKAWYAETRSMEKAQV